MITKVKAYIWSTDKDGEGVMNTTWAVVFITEVFTTWAVVNTTA